MKPLTQINRSEIIFWFQSFVIIMCEIRSLHMLPNLKLFCVCVLVCYFKIVYCYLSTPSNQRMLWNVSAPLKLIKHKKGVK